MVAIGESQALATSTTNAKLGELLHEYSEVAVILPVLAGLFVTSRLQLRGANALIVNLIIAAIARQALHHLKDEATIHQADNNGAALTDVGDTNNTEMAEDYKILHSLSGRIRLQIPQLQKDRNFVKRLESSLLDDPIVSSVRINQAAASVVINYLDGGLSELDLGLRLLKILDQAKQAEATATAHAVA